jgi:hypothetical protein
MQSEHEILVYLHSLDCLSESVINYFQSLSLAFGRIFIKNQFKILH